MIDEEQTEDVLGHNALIAKEMSNLKASIESLSATQCAEIKASLSRSYKAGIWKGAQLKLKKIIQEINAV